MNSFSKLSASVALAAGVVMGGMWLAPAVTSASHARPSDTGTISLPAPSEPGVPRIPGKTAPTENVATNMGVLSVSPNTGFPGEWMTIAGTGLAKNASVLLTWSTATATWDVQASPGTVNYLGREATKFAVILTKTKTDSSGDFSVKIRVPHDWGGLHDIYAVVDGSEVAHGGYLISRKFTISPTSGPIGTRIHITYTGLAPSLYDGGAALLYDNKSVGELMANWTRGTAKAMIRAAGPVGKHTLQIGDAVGNLYLNLQQAPDSWAIGGTRTFTVTNDAGRPQAAIDWPMKVKPTVSNRTTLQANVTSGSSVYLKLSSRSGAVNSKVKVSATGLKTGQPVTIQWATVIGSRVNCTSICWAFTSLPLGTVKAVSGNLKTTLRVPNNLGGWHVLQLTQGGKIVAQKTFYVTESIVGRGVSSLVVKEGHHFTIHLRGVGWTQLDNTVGVDYDDNFIGYGCGFASNGDVVLNMRATGGPGTHLLDLYPMLYTLQPSFPDTPYGLLPVLTYARDYPGLAMGYKLPVIRLAITVVK